MKSPLSLLPLVVGVSAVVGYDEVVIANPDAWAPYEVTCQSTEGSPYLHHVYEVADMVNTEKLCYQTNKSGSHCTKLYEGEGARISICGPSSEVYNIPCKDVAGMAQAVADKCSNGVENAERAGGYVYRLTTTFDGWNKDVPWISVSRKP